MEDLANCNYTWCERSTDQVHLGDKLRQHTDLAKSLGRLSDSVPKIQADNSFLDLEENRDTIFLAKDIPVGNATLAKNENDNTFALTKDTPVETEHVPEDS